MLRHVTRIPKDLAFPLTLKVFDQILGLTKYFGDLFCFRMSFREAVEATSSSLAYITRMPCEAVLDSLEA